MIPTSNSPGQGQANPNNSPNPQQRSAQVQRTPRPGMMVAGEPELLVQFQAPIYVFCQPGNYNVTRNFGGTIMPPRAYGGTAANSVQRREEFFQRLAQTVARQPAPDNCVICSSPMNTP